MEQFECCAVGRCRALSVQDNLELDNYITK
jgi:hypothetical protein